MKKIALFIVAAGMLSMVACKSAPKQEAAVEPVATEAEVAAPEATPADTTVVETPAETPAEGTVDEK